MAPQAHPAPSPYSVDLVMEVMRGLAALWVFLFHMAPIVAQSIPALHDFALIGFWGVPIFFVVSGYCIFAAAQRAAKTGDGAYHFVRRRAIRIYPTFWVTVAVVLCTPFLMELIAAAKTGHLAWPQLKWSTYSLIEWLGVLSLTKELLDHAGGGHGGYIPINAVYWTLAIEVQFYLVLYAAIRCGKRWMACLITISLLCSLAMLLHILMWDGLFVRFWMAFACGIVLRLSHTANFAPSRLFKGYELAGSGLTLVLIAAAFVVFQPIHGESQAAFIMVAAIAAVTMWCLGGIEHALRARRTPGAVATFFAYLAAPFVMLGQCSYSLYLLHVKVAQLPEMFVRQIIRPTHPLYLVLTMLVTVAISYVFYLLVERRFQRHPGSGAAAASPLVTHGAPASGTSAP